jgi:pimeloyl-ACP methyl ester carboxylesterase
MRLSEANSSTAKPDSGSTKPGSTKPGKLKSGHPEPVSTPEPTATRQVVVHKRTFVQGRPAGYSVAGSGMPVVFLHGWALGDHTYRDVISSIASLGCRVIAPAMPGFGGTHDLPKEQFSMAGYGRWVADLLAALDIDEPAVVVGHSFGGGVAIRLAHDHPLLVRSLVLVNSVGGSSWRKGQVVRSIAERPLWDWGLHFPSDVWPFRQATRVLPVLIEDFVPNLIRNPRAIARVANLARRADLRTELEGLRKRRLPITILWGSRDGIIPRESFEALCVAAGVVGTVVDGSHSWLLADPQQFGEVITNNMTVAKLARDLEQAAPPKKRRPLRRVKSLIDKATAPVKDRITGSDSAGSASGGSDGRESRPADS